MTEDDINKISNLAVLRLINSTLRNFKLSLDDKDENSLQWACEVLSKLEIKWGNDINTIIQTVNKEKELLNKHGVCSKCSEIGSSMLCEYFASCDCATSE